MESSSRKTPSAAMSANTLFALFVSQVVLLIRFILLLDQSEDWNEDRLNKRLSQAFRTRNTLLVSL